MLDERTRQFLEIVDCDPSQVRDALPSLSPVQQKRRQDDSLGNYVLHFKKHNGERLADIPVGYLKAVADLPKIQNKGAEKAKRKIREYLKIIGHDDSSKGGKGAKNESGSKENSKPKTALSTWTMDDPCPRCGFLGEHKLTHTDGSSYKATCGKCKKYIKFFSERQVMDMEFRDIVGR